MSGFRGEARFQNDSAAFRHLRGASLEHFEVAQVFGRDRIHLVGVLD